MNKKATYMGIKFSPQKHIVQYVFHMDPPLENSEYVLVSASNLSASDMAQAGWNLSIRGLSFQPETYIFSCDVSGEIQDYVALTGSYRGGLSHATALANAGYEISEYETTLFEGSK